MLEAAGKVSTQLHFTCRDATSHFATQLMAFVEREVPININPMLMGSDATNMGPVS